MDPVRISIADDHPVVLNGLKHILLGLDHVTVSGTYSSGQELLADLPGNTPDILFLDVHMPGMQGDEVARTVRRLYPSVRMIALTNLDSGWHIRNMFNSGVHGYVLKSSSEATLIEAIEAVREGNQYLEGALKNTLLQTALNPERRPAGRPELTQRELEVLQLIARNHTSREIADMLFISKRTVDQHRKNIHYKLEAKNTLGIVWKAQELGLIG